MKRKEFKRTLDYVARSRAVGKTFDQIISEPDPIEFITGLVDYGGWPHRPINEEVKVVPRERRMVILIDILSRTICSGGVEQLVCDPVAGGLFDEIIACCKTIAANKAVAFLERMTSYFPNGEIPKDEKQRFEMIENIKRTKNIRNFRALNKEFAGASVEAIEALRQFILKNLVLFAEVLSNPK